MLCSDGTEVYHIYPVAEEAEHQFDGKHCTCVPEYDIRHDRILVLHHDAAHRSEWQSGTNCTVPIAPDAAS